MTFLTDKNFKVRHHESHRYKQIPMVFSINYRMKVCNMKTFLNKVNYLMLVVAGSLLLNASYIAAAPRVNPNIPPIIKGNGCGL